MKKNSPNYEYIVESVIRHINSQFAVIALFIFITEIPPCQMSIYLLSLNSANYFDNYKQIINDANSITYSNNVIYRNSMARRMTCKIKIIFSNLF